MSRGSAMVRLQQSAQTLDVNDLTLTTFMLGLDDPVEALVNPLVMVVLEVHDRLPEFLIQAVGQAGQHRKPQTSSHSPWRLTGCGLAGKRFRQTMAQVKEMKILTLG